MCDELNSFIEIKEEVIEEPDVIKYENFNQKLDPSSSSSSCYNSNIDIKQEEIEPASPILSSNNSNTERKCYEYAVPLSSKSSSYKVNANEKRLIGKATASNNPSISRKRELPSSSTSSHNLETKRFKVNGVEFNVKVVKKETVESTNSRVVNIEKLKPMGIKRVSPLVKFIPSTSKSLTSMSNSKPTTTTAKTDDLKNDIDRLWGKKFTSFRCKHCPFTTKMFFDAK